MKIHIYLFLPCIMLGSNLQPSTARSDGTSAEVDASRQKLYITLLKQSVLDPDRVLLSLTHVCSLQIDKIRYPVLWLRELVRNTTASRGVNRLVVLNPELRASVVLDNMSGTTQPLFCLGNRLYLHGEESIGNVAPYGNILQLGDHGRMLTVIGSAELKDFPLPLTKERQLMPQ